MKWPTVPLSSVTSLITKGTTPTTLGKAYAKSGIPFLRAENLQNGVVALNGNLLFIDEETDSLLSRSVIEPNDVLISIAGTIGRVGLVPDHAQRMNCNQAVAIVRPTTLLQPRFLMYWLMGWDAVTQMAGSKVTQTISNLSLGQIGNLKLPLPAGGEQSRIVELLDEADRLRRLRREADANAARILPALFLKMFGDPATNPMGWPTNRLDFWFDVFGGGTPSKANDEYWKGDIPWVSPKDMKVDVIQDTEDHITQEAIANSATKLVDPGSILIVYRSGILAHTFPVAIAGRTLTLNQDLKALTSRGEVLNEFIYGWLMSGQKLALSCVKKGATVHNIDGGRFLGLQVPKPPRHLQEDFARHLQALLLQKNEREKAAQEVETLFALLLQKAFAGQLTAKWREGHMQELLAEMAHQAHALNLPMPRELEELP